MMAGRCKQALQEGGVSQGKMHLRSIRPVNLPVSHAVVTRPTSETPFYKSVFQSQGWQLLDT